MSLLTWSAHVFAAVETKQQSVAVVLGRGRGQGLLAEAGSGAGSGSCCASWKSLLAACVYAAVLHSKIQVAVHILRTQVPSTKITCITVLKLYAGVKSLLAGEQQAAVTVAVDTLMEAKPGSEADSFLTLDPKVCADKAVPGCVDGVCQPHCQTLLGLHGHDHVLGWRRLTLMSIW